MGSALGDFQPLDQVKGYFDYDFGDVDVQFVSYSIVLLNPLRELMRTASSAWLHPTCFRPLLGEHISSSRCFV